jgi:signal peptidase I
VHTHNESPFDSLDASPGGIAETFKKRRSLGILALVATLALPGAGHALSGLPRRGLAWLAALVALNLLALLLLSQPATAATGILAGLMAVLVMIAALVDAYRCGARSQSLRSLSAAPLILLSGLAAAAIPFAGPWPLLNQYCAKLVRDRYVAVYAMAGAAMAPTLQAGDFVLVHRRREPARWSIVIVEHPQYARPTSSRIAGLPGETVEIRTTGLHIDGKKVELPNDVMPYTSMVYAGMHDSNLSGRRGAGCEGNPIRLRDDEYFILGDNSARALDSRLWELPADGHQLGALPRSHIVGCVTTRLRPPLTIRSL